MTSDTMWLLLAMLFLAFVAFVVLTARIDGQEAVRPAHASSPFIVPHRLHRNDIQVSRLSRGPAQTLQAP
jgi:hypothetical protein